MFDEIAPAYDKLNHLFTMNTDKKWRREIVNYIKINNYTSENIADIASGTGDITIELIKLNPKRICAVDISRKMLDIQKEKIKYQGLELIQSDAGKLDLGDNTFDIVTVGFGIRNFENLKESLKEIKRILKPDGKLIVLEMFRTDTTASKIFDIYFGNVMPMIGNRISGSKSAYNYLFDSVKNFLSVDEFISLAKTVGFEVQFVKNNFLEIVNTIYLSALPNPRIVS